MASPPAGARTPPVVALLMVPALGVLWGSNWPAVKIILTEMGPWSLRATGLSFGSALVALTALVLGRSLAVPRRHWVRLVAAGLLTVAGFNIFIAFAQAMAPVGRAAVVTFTMPVWATLFARVLLGERFDRRRIAGIVLGISGLVCLGLPLLRAGELSAGLLFALLGGISWAAGIVVAKRWPVEAEPLAGTTWQLVVGAVLAVAGMLAFEGVPHPHAVSGTVWAALVYHVAVAIALCYFLWFEIASRVPAGVAALGTLMIPAVGMVSAAIVLGERPTATDVAGLVLVVLAAATVLIPAPRPRPDPVSAG